MVTWSRDPGGFALKRFDCGCLKRSGELDPDRTSRPGFHHSCQFLRCPEAKPGQGPRMAASAACAIRPTWYLPTLSNANVGRHPSTSSSSSTSYARTHRRSFILVTVLRSTTSARLWTFRAGVGVCPSERLQCCREHLHEGPRACPRPRQSAPHHAGRSRIHPRGLATRRLSRFGGLKGDHQSVGSQAGILMPQDTPGDGRWIEPW